MIKANYIFFPYLENEKEKLNNEDDLKNILPNYYVRYLKPNKKQLCDRKGIDSNKWWMLTRPRMWQCKHVQNLFQQNLENQAILVSIKQVNILWNADVLGF